MRIIIQADEKMFVVYTLQSLLGRRCCRYALVVSIVSFREWHYFRSKCSTMIGAPKNTECSSRMDSPTRWFLLLVGGALASQSASQPASQPTVVERVISLRRGGRRSSYCQTGGCSMMSRVCVYRIDMWAAVVDVAALSAHDHHVVLLPAGYCCYDSGCCITRSGPCMCSAELHATDATEG